MKIFLSLKAKAPKCFGRKEKAFPLCDWKGFYLMSNLLSVSSVQLVLLVN